MMQLKAKAKSTGGSIGIVANGAISKLKSLTGYDMGNLGLTPMKIESLIQEAESDIDIENELKRLGGVRKTLRVKSKRFKLSDFCLD